MSNKNGPNKSNRVQAKIKCQSQGEQGKDTKTWERAGKLSAEGTNMNLN